MRVKDARQRISKPLPTERPVCDPEYLNRLAERLSITAGLSRELARRRVMSMTRRAISAGPDRSYVVSAAPLLLHDDRRADLDSVIEIDHVLIGQANAAR